MGYSGCNNHRVTHMHKTFFIKTFGCQQNTADSERIRRYYEDRGYTAVAHAHDADVVIINSCMIRGMAEEKVYGYIRNVRRRAVADGHAQEIVLAGCIVGAAGREPSGTLRTTLARRLPDVTIVPTEEIAASQPHRAPGSHAWVTISNGCNNFCSYCIVPFASGTEVSRPFADIVDDVRRAVADGYTSITLVGQNVNSYGADIVRRSADSAAYVLPDGQTVAPVMVAHLGKTRIPTLFPYLLEAVAQIPGVRTVTFTSSNPWDFSDALIAVIARNATIDRMIHLPVQSGSDAVLAAMRRWYTAHDFEQLTQRIVAAVPDATFATDIIVGFPGETQEAFDDTVALVRRVGFVKAFIGCYSPRPGTHAATHLPDTIPWDEKKRRWHIINDLINKANRGVTYDKDWVRR